MWKSSVNRISLRSVVRVVSQSVCVKYCDILSSPVGTWATVDVEKFLKVGCDVVLDGAHVQRSVPGSDERFPTNQRQLGRFLSEGGMKE